MAWKFIYSFNKHSLPNMLFPAPFKTDFLHNLFSWETYTESKFPLHNSVNILTKLENRQNKFLKYS